MANDTKYPVQDMVSNDRNISFDTVREDLKRTRSQTTLFSDSDVLLDIEPNVEEQLREQVSNLTNEMNALNTDMQQYKSDMDQHVQTVVQYEERMQQVESHAINSPTITEYNGEFDNTNIPGAEDRLFDLETKVDQLVQDISTTDGIGRIKDAVKDANEAVAKLDDLIEKAEQELLPIDEVAKEIDAAKVSMTGTKEKTLAGRLTKDFRRITDILEDANYIEREGYTIHETKNTLGGYTRDLNLQGNTVHNLINGDSTNTLITPVHANEREKIFEIEASDKPRSVMISSIEGETLTNVITESSSEERTLPFAPPRSTNYTLDNAIGNHTIQVESIEGSTVQNLVEQEEYPEEGIQLPYIPEDGIHSHMDNVESGYVDLSKIKGHSVKNELLADDTSSILVNLRPNSGEDTVINNSLKPENKVIVNTIQGRTIQNVITSDSKTETPIPLANDNESDSFTLENCLGEEVYIDEIKGVTMHNVLTGNETSPWLYAYGDTFNIKDNLKYDNNLFAINGRFNEFIIEGNTNMNLNISDAGETEPVLLSDNHVYEMSNISENDYLPNVKKNILKFSINGETVKNCLDYVGETTDLYTESKKTFLEQDLNEGRDYLENIFLPCSDMLINNDNTHTEYDIDANEFLLKKEISYNDHQFFIKLTTSKELKPNTTYTIILTKLTSLDNRLCVYACSDEKPFPKVLELLGSEESFIDSGEIRFTFTTNDISDREFYLALTKIAYIDEFRFKDVMILEGDYVTKEVPTYFKESYGKITYTEDHPMKKLVIHGKTIISDNELISVKFPIEKIISTSNDTIEKSLYVDEEIILHSLDNIADTLDVHTGVYSKYIDVVTFDGSKDENWIYNKELSCFFVTHNGVSTDSKLMSTFTILDDLGDGSIDGIFARDNAFGIVVKNNLEFKFITKLRAYLKENPITIQYELTEPIIRKVALYNEDKVLYGKEKLSNGKCDLYNVETKTYIKNTNTITLNESLTWENVSGNKDYVLYKTVVNDMKYYVDGETPILDNNRYHKAYPVGYLEENDVEGISFKEDGIILKIAKNRITNNGYTDFISWITNNSFDISYETESNGVTIELDEVMNVLEMSNGLKPILNGYLNVHSLDVEPKVQYRLPSYNSYHLDNLEDGKLYTLVADNNKIETLSEEEFTKGKSTFATINIESLERLVFKIPEKGMMIIAGDKTNSEFYSKDNYINSELHHFDPGIVSIKVNDSTECTIYVDEPLKSNESAYDELVLEYDEINHKYVQTYIKRVDEHSRNTNDPIIKTNDTSYSLNAALKDSTIELETYGDIKPNVNCRLTFKSTRKFKVTGLKENTDYTIIPDLVETTTTDRGYFTSTVFNVSSVDAEGYITVDQTYDGCNTIHIVEGNYPNAIMNETKIYGEGMSVSQFTDTSNAVSYGSVNLLSCFCNINNTVFNTSSITAEMEELLTLRRINDSLYDEYNMRENVITKRVGAIHLFKQSSARWALTEEINDTLNKYTLPINNIDGTSGIDTIKIFTRDNRFTVSNAIEENVFTANTNGIIFISSLTSAEEVNELFGGLDVMVLYKLKEETVYKDGDIRKHLTGSDEAYSMVKNDNDTPFISMSPTSIKDSNAVPIIKYRAKTANYFDVKGLKTGQMMITGGTSGTGTITIGGTSVTLNNQPSVVTVSNTNVQTEGYTDVQNLSLIYGDVTPKGYVKGIQGVHNSETGLITITNAGKNKLNTSLACVERDNVTISNIGVSLIDNALPGKFKFDMNGILDNGKEYTISMKLKYLSSDAHITINQYISGIKNTVTYEGSLIPSEFKHTFANPDYVLEIELFKVHVDLMQIEEGSQATKFESFSSDTFTIDTNWGTTNIYSTDGLYGFNDTIYDTMEIDTDEMKAYVTKRVGKLVIDGRNYNITSQPNDNSYYYPVTVDTNTNITFTMINAFSVNSGFIKSSFICNYPLLRRGNGVICQFNPLHFTSKNDLKMALIDNPAIMLYPLEKPVYYTVDIKSENFVANNTTTLTPNEDIYLITRT